MSSTPRRSRTPATHPPGIYETEHAPEGLVSIVGLDRENKVQLTAKVTQAYYDWLVKHGHIDVASENLTTFSDERDEEARPPLRLMRSASSEPEPLQSPPPGDQRRAWEVHDGSEPRE